MLYGVYNNSKKSLQLTVEALYLSVEDLKTEQDQKEINRRKDTNILFGAQYLPGPESDFQSPKSQRAKG